MAMRIRELNSIVIFKFLSVIKPMKDHSITRENILSE